MTSNKPKKKPRANIPKVTSISECVELVTKTLDNLRDTILSYYPYITDICQEAYNYTINYMYDRYCSKILTEEEKQFLELAETEEERKILKKLVKGKKTAYLETTIVNATKYTFLSTLFNIIIHEDKQRKFNFDNMIRLFPEIFTEPQFAEPLIRLYGYKDIILVELLLRAYIAVNHIPELNLRIILNAIKAESLSFEERYFFLILCIYYLEENGYLPVDIIEYFPYYISTLSDFSFNKLIELAPLSILSILFPSLIPRLIVATFALSLLTSNLSLMNMLFEFALVDRYTILALNALEELNLIPEKRFEEAISHLFHFTTIAYEFSELKYVVKYAYLYLIEYNIDAPNRLKSRIEQILNTYSGKLLGIASNAFDLTHKLLQILDSIMIETNYRYKELKALIEAQESMLSVLITLSKLEGKSKTPDIIHLEKSIEISKRRLKLYKISRYLYTVYFNLLNNMRDKLLEIIRVIV